MDGFTGSSKAGQDTNEEKISAELASQMSPSQSASLL